ncbi:MAG: hypothetical protein HQ579_08125 [Candidatus Omnitrophica bacterium]|nr:hypothetical protein [Candidatus Omnitrophota bacterium]
MKHKPISRQLKWQRKKKRQGLCEICGKKPLYKGGICKEHYLKKLPSIYDWQNKHRERCRANSRAWRKKHAKKGK